MYEFARIRTAYKYVAAARGTSYTSTIPDTNSRTTSYSYTVVALVSYPTTNRTEYRHIYVLSYGVRVREYEYVAFSYPGTRVSRSVRRWARFSNPNVQYNTIL